ncbi:hypothetical protein AVEN_263426-1 [Araneus ventricosus]|uniref:Uncharacterized protein n=1 Tax=Araneus ventricosus TaxID=182803 RepID=A0A4Y2TUA9_ARAVE|nr:hypothetical protein AVEN_263426-1 [Araneus ventricosus]
MNNDPAIIKAKMLLIKREYIRIRALLEEKHVIIKSHVRGNVIRVERLVGELIPRISAEIRENFVYEASEKTKEDNEKLVNEIKINSEKILTKTFTMVKNSQSNHGSGRNVIDNDCVLIVKPSDEDNEILIPE